MTGKHYLAKIIEQAPTHLQIFYFQETIQAVRYSHGSIGHERHIHHHQSRERPNPYVQSCSVRYSRAIQLLRP